MYSDHISFIESINHLSFLSVSLFVPVYGDSGECEGEYWARGNTDVYKMPLYDSMLGGPGDEENSQCVAEDPWTVDDYTTDYLCADWEEEGECCLKRVCGLDYNDSKLWSRSEFNEILYEEKFTPYGTDVCHHII